MPKPGPQPPPEPPDRPGPPAGPEGKPTLPDIHQQTGIASTGNLQVSQTGHGSTPSLPDIRRTAHCSDALSTSKQEEIVCQSDTEKPDYKSLSRSSLEPGNSNSPKAGAISSFSDGPYFAVGGNKPKVQISFQREAGDVSRELAIVRLTREYSRLDFEALLAERGIDSHVFIPRHLRNGEEHQSETGNVTRPFLLLEFFDNEDFDCRTPEEWLALGDDEGSPDRRPVPATALLPKPHQTLDENRPLVEYCWYLVGVLDYNSEKCQYFVQEVQDKDGNPILNPKHWKKVNASQRGLKRWIPRIRLCFHGEDPRVFVDRVSFAQRFREDVENRILRDLSVDHMPLWGGAPRLSPETMEKIQKCANSAPGLRLDIIKKHEKVLEKEVELEYARCMNNITLDFVVKTNPELFSNIALPQEDPKAAPDQEFTLVPEYPYEMNQNAFASVFLYSQPNLLRAVSSVRLLCHKVANMRLFNLQLWKCLPLDEFKLIQTQSYTQVSSYLEHEWSSSVRSSLHANLGDLSKRDFDVFKTSGIYVKLFRLLKVVHLLMHDALYDCLQSSLHSLTQVVGEASQSVQRSGQDLILYKQEEKSLFTVKLVMEETGFRFSPPLEDFRISLFNLFDEGIKITEKVKKVNKLELKDVVVQSDGVLMSKRWLKQEVKHLKEQMHDTLLRAAATLTAYAAQCEKHLELQNLHIQASSKSYNEEWTSREVKMEVERLVKESKEQQYSLPSSLTIGPFFVRVKNLYQSPVQKRQDMADALLSQLALKLRKQVENVCKECSRISKQLQEKANNIEELSGKREWMKDIAAQLQRFQERVMEIFSEYEILEGLYTISEEDFKRKWAARTWPGKIISQMENVTMEDQEDEERFRKIQILDQNHFEEELDHLQMAFSELIGYEDIDLVQETAIKFNNMNMKLKECMTKAQLYSTRERLLALPVTNQYERLQRLQTVFQPHLELCTTVSDWQHWSEVWVHSPLSSINLEQLEHITSHAEKTICKCMEHFKDVFHLQTMMTETKKKMEDFRPHARLIKALKEPAMKSHHWDLLSERIRIKVRPDGNLHLTHYLKLGLQNHVEDVVQMAEMTAKEHSSKQTEELVKSVLQSAGDWRNDIHRVLLPVWYGAFAQPLLCVSLQPLLSCAVHRSRHEAEMRD